MRRQDDRSGMLKYHGEDYVVCSLHRIEQKTAGADPEICVARRYRSADINIRTAFANFDLDPVLAIKSLFDRGVIAGKLVLMLPFELERHLVERVGLGDEQQREADRQTSRDQRVPLLDWARS